MYLFIPYLSDFKHIIQNTISRNKIIKQIKCLPRN